MEIRHLQTFIAIVEQGGFTKAADQLGYAQSTITSHIQILENEIGHPLFDRLGKKNTLTSVGKRLVPYARQMLGVYKEIKNMSLEEQIIGELVIGVSESLTIYRLGEILKAYKSSYPNVNIILKSAKCSELRSHLYNGNIDITITIEPEVIDSNLRVIQIKKEEMVVVAAPRVDLSFLTKNPRKYGVNSNIIFSEQGCAARAIFEEYLRQQQIKYVNPLELSSIEAIKKCVINELGISLLPYYTVKEEIQQGILKQAKDITLPHQFSIQLAYHKDKNISLPMEKLIEMMINFNF